MNINVYSVKDSKVGFGTPIACINDEMALRQFIGSVRAETPNVCNTYPEDKSFWKLGSFDEATGVFTTDLRELAKAQVYIQPAPAPDELAAERERYIEKLNALLAEKDKTITSMNQQIINLTPSPVSIKEKKKCKLFKKSKK